MVNESLVRVQAGSVGVTGETPKKDNRNLQLDDLELRDISDHKLRKVLRDLDLQTSRLSQDDQACEQGEATAI